MLSFLKCWASLRRTFSTFPPSQVQAYACSDVCCSQTHKLLINRILKYQNQYSFVLIQSMPYDLLHDSHDMRIFHEISERLFFTWIIIFSAPWLLFFSLSLSLQIGNSFWWWKMRILICSALSSIIFIFHISTKILVMIEWPRIKAEITNFTHESSIDLSHCELLNQTNISIRMDTHS